MTSDRPYRKALEIKEAVKELRRCAGTQFDVQLVDVFCKELERNKQEVEEKKREWSGTTPSQNPTTMS